MFIGPVFETNLIERKVFEQRMIHDAVLQSNEEGLFWVEHQESWKIVRLQISTFHQQKQERIS